MILSCVRFGSVAALLVLVAAGCGSSEKTSPITGKITVPSGVKLTETDTVTVDFQPDEAGKTKGGTVSIKGTESSFTINAPPGKHKVSVTIKPYPGEKDSDKRDKEISNLVGMYKLGASSLRYEVVDGPQTITIDLGKGAVTKN